VANVEISKVTRATALVVLAVSYPCWWPVRRRSLLNGRSLTGEAEGGPFTPPLENEVVISDRGLQPVHLLGGRSPMAPFFPAGAPIVGKPT